MSLAIFRQMQYLTAFDLGVAIDNTLVIRKPGSSMQDSLKKGIYEGSKIFRKAVILFHRLGNK